jgi:hypothetical protein
LEEFIELLNSVAVMRGRAGNDARREVMTALRHSPLAANKERNKRETGENLQ